MSRNNSSLGFGSAMPQIGTAVAVSVVFVIIGIVFSLLVFGETPEPFDEYMEASEWNYKIMIMFIITGVLSIVSNIVSTIAAHHSEYKQSIWWIFVVVNFVLGIGLLVVCALLYPEKTWCHIFAFAFFVLEPVVTFFAASIPIPKSYRGGYNPFAG